MKTVAVIFGGRSTEHDVSIITAISSVIGPLELLSDYKPIAVYIAKDGKWYADESLKDVQFFSLGNLEDKLSKLTPVSLTFENSKLILSSHSRFSSKKIVIDIAFPATHGTYGEDGSLMGLLRMSGLPYVGCSMESSVIAMNKLLAHQVVEKSGIDAHPYLAIDKSTYEEDKQAAIGTFDKLDLPVFVKPVHLGSSIGISRVSSKDRLKDALDLAFSFDEVVIVEEAVKNLVEVTVPVKGTTANPVAGLVERPLFDTEKGFDFETKYLNQGKSGKTGKSSGKGSGSQGYSELPAQLPAELYEQCEEMAKEIFRIAGCYGIARIDLLIDSKTSVVYFNEINPLPGSLYLHNWRQAGVSSVQLIDELVKLAEKRAEEESVLATTFSTNFLKQF